MLNEKINFLCRESYSYPSLFFFSEDAQRIFMLTPWKMLLKRSIFFYFSFGTQEQSLKMTQTEMKLNWL